MNKDLIKRILVTLMLIVIYRIGCYIFLAGVDISQLLDIFPMGNSKSFFGIVNMFSGGALSQLAVFALGVTPYISASMMVQMLSSPIGFEFFIKLKKEGAAGRAKLEKYTHWASFLLAFAQALLACSIVVAKHRPQIETTFYMNKFLFLITGVLTLMTGSMVTIFLASQISKKGIGDGQTLIMYTGIISQISSFLLPYIRRKGVNIFQNPGSVITKKNLIIFFSIITAVLLVIMIVENIYRVVHVKYTSLSNSFVPSINARQKLSLPSTQKMLWKINIGGVMASVMANIMMGFMNYPINFVQSILKKIPFLLKYITSLETVLSRGDILYNVFYGIILVICNITYAPIVFSSKEIADNLRKSHACIPGVSQGEKTAIYLENIILTLVYISSVYLLIICITPNMASFFLKIPTILGGTALLILVSGALSVFSNIVAYSTPNYMKLFKKEGITFRSSNVKSSL